MNPSLILEAKLFESILNLICLPISHPSDFVESTLLWNGPNLQQQHDCTETWGSFDLFWLETTLRSIEITMNLRNPFRLKLLLNSELTPTLLSRNVPLAGNQGMLKHGLWFFRNGNYSVLGASIRIRLRKLCKNPWENATKIGWCIGANSKNGAVSLSTGPVSMNQPQNHWLNWLDSQIRSAMICHTDRNASMRWFSSHSSVDG